MLIGARAGPFNSAVQGLSNTCPQTAAMRRNMLMRGQVSNKPKRCRSPAAQAAQAPARPSDCNASETVSSTPGCDQQTLHNCRSHGTRQRLQGVGFAPEQTAKNSPGHSRCLGPDRACGDPVEFRNEVLSSKVRVPFKHLHRLVPTDRSDVLIAQACLDQAADRLVP